VPWENSPVRIDNNIRYPFWKPVVKNLKFLYLLVGLVLLALVLAHTDLSQLWDQTVRVGWGIGVILTLYLIAFVLDSVSWQLALLPLNFDSLTICRVWKIRMVGEAVNNATPLATIGGEPVKAVLLKKNFGTGYREGTASLIIAKTTNLLALIAFLATGFGLMLVTEVLPPFYNFVAGAGLITFTAGIVLLFLVQRYKISSLAGTWMAQTRLGRFLENLLHHIHDMEDRLIHFYTRHRLRFLLALVLAFVNWVIGALELYVTLLFLGHPVTFGEAWIIEAIAQLVRSGAFFIPGALGIQEGAFMIVIEAMTGRGVLGLAVAMIRRFREIVWITWGMLLGGFSSFSPQMAEEVSPEVSGEPASPRKPRT
jgi:uncharacterized protein (TIRG00374 family)|tara:strand:+ start:2407 stop:3510 length:1104 start_codon:yes stop_codon:yes gene_type:complete